MSLTFLVFDKERKYTSTLGDIFDVTGHRLLVALNEDKLRELLDKARVDIMLMELEDLELWLDTLEKSDYAKPIFFLSDYKEAEELKKIGFVEENFAVLPFNPLDLLSNAVFLSKETTQWIEKGFVNLMLDILRRKLSVNFEINKKCTISIKNGIIRGYTCSDEELIKAISNQENDIELSPYVEGLIVSRTVKNNTEVFRTIIQRKYEHKKDRKEKIPSIRIEGYYAKPIEIIKDVFWVGSVHENDIIQTNTYLHLYRKEGLRLPILINAGGNRNYADIKGKIEQVIGSVENLKAIILMDLEIDDFLNAYRFMQANSKLYVITSLPIAKELYKLNIPVNRIRLIENLDNGILKLPTGEVLRFIHTPFCPSKGSFVFYEENTGILYSGLLFSSYASSINLNPDADMDAEILEIFHIVNMPSSQALQNTLKVIEGLKIKLILPKYGSFVQDPQKAVGILKKAKVGLEALQTPAVDTGEILKDLIKSCRYWLSDKEFLEFTKLMSRYMYISDDLSEIEIYADVKLLPSIIITTLMSLKANSETILNVLKFFHSRGMLNFTL